MSQAVGVLIVDEPAGLDPNFRATLEHTPALRTIGEDELERGEPGESVALVFLCESLIDESIGHVASLRGRYPDLRIMAIFRSLGSDDLRRLLDAGCDAFVGRGTPAREVCRVVLALAGAAFAGEGASAMSGRGPGDGAADLVLTPREAEVLRFLSAGFSNKEVARRLSLSVRTVETHRLNLRRKTQTGRLKDLVSLARRLGLDPVLEQDHPRRAAQH